MSTAEDKSFATIRIVFGLMWLIDAAFKCNAAFLNSFTYYLAQGAQGQSLFVQAWIDLWVRGASIDPHLFGIVVIVSELAIAVGLLFGLFTQVAILGGLAMTVVVWSTAEGFGGPYVPGSIGVTAAIVYAIVFVALWAGRSWKYYSVDSLLMRRFPSIYRYW